MYAALNYSSVLKESLRRTVRELFAFWILPVIPIMLCLEKIGTREDDAAILAILFAAVLCIPLWLFYRLTRFALNR
jgi:hypothetical protein